MRETIRINKEWLFHKGDLKTEMPHGQGIAVFISKTEREYFSPASRHYIPITHGTGTTACYTADLWDTVDLPHDFIVGGIADEQYNPAHGYLPYDNGWYIKYLEFDEADRGKRITLYFEGVATTSTVYLNGCLLKRSFTGYTPFEVDITDVVRFGERNNLAVYVNTEQHESWWYEGGGIYRNVFLTKTDLLSVDLYGVYVKPALADGAWTVPTEVTLRNDGYETAKATLLGEILDADGTVVATATAEADAAPRDKTVIRYSFALTDAHLWSPDDPYQYTMRTRVLKNGEAVDEYDVRFGCRTFEIDPDKGLFINGKHVKIKGVCAHEDCGLVGKAVPDNIHRYKVQMLKDMGCNGYRCAHYPQATPLMDALDEGGFIVMSEVRRFESSEEGLANLDILVKRDRNRPGVFFWSTGNEEPYHATEQGRKIYAAMAARIRALDDTRPILAAVNLAETATVFDQLDIIGLNYNWWHYDTLREKFPQKTFIATENCATGTTRGWYLPDCPEQGYMTAYDHTTAPWRHLHFSSREFYWNHITERDWVLGGYQWAGFEHRGEATWPRLCSLSGAIDLFLQKKDAFYQNRAYWTDEPMVHLLPHWNWRGMEGQPIKVFAYSNVPTLELFLDGESLGVCEVQGYGHGEWSVPFKAGKLEVVAYKNGEVVARDVRITSGAAKRLVLTLDSKDIKANGSDIAIVTCFVVDENGNEVYDAAPEVTFSTNELGKIYSTGSDISDHSSLFRSTRKMRAGRISVAVKTTEKEGDLQLYAYGNGLESAVLTIPLKK